MSLYCSEYDNTLATVYIRDLEKAKKHLDVNEFHKARDIVEGIIKDEGEKDGLINFLSLIDSEQKKEYKLELIRCKSNRFFNLAVIKAQAKVGNLEFFKTYKVRGWVEIGINEQPLLIVRSKTNEIEFELNENRPDVVKTLAEKGKSVKLACGFNFHVDVSAGAQIGFKINETISWLVEFKLKPLIDAEKTAFKNNSSNNMPIRDKNEVGVLKGKDEWLFVNDSKKVDKITGKLLLSTQQKTNLYTLSQNLVELQRNYNFLYVIVSAKEKVRSDKYPYTIEDTTMVEQVEDIFNIAKINYLNILPELQRNKDSFCKTDTLWSDVGCYVSYKKIMSNSNNLNYILEPKFINEETVGDLGSKLNPVEKSLRKKFIKNPKVIIETVFDNIVRTIGGVRVYINPSLTNSKKVVVFGDDTTRIDQLTTYLSYSFSRVVEVNLDGSLIEEIIHYERPDLVIVLAHEYFLDQVGAVFPTFIRSPAADSLDKLNGAIKVEVLKFMETFSNESFYYDLITEILIEGSQ